MGYTANIKLKQQTHTVGYKIDLFHKINNKWSKNVDKRLHRMSCRY